MTAPPASQPRRYRPVIRKKHAGLAGLVVAGVVVLAAIGVLVLTQTDFGRNFTRDRVVDILTRNSRGIIKIGEVRGNLLRNVTLIDVSITDSSGAPLIIADTIYSEYGLRALLGKRIELSGLRIVNAHIVIERLPGQRWNYDRIFPRDTVPRTGPREPGWGTWIGFTDVSLVNVDLTTRAPWTPGGDKGDADRRITQALAGEGRVRIIRVPGGYQNVAEYRDIHARLPIVRLNDPDHRVALIDIASARLHAMPFNPPTLLVRALTGRVQFNKDSVWWADARTELSASRAVVSGRYRTSGGDLRLRLRASAFSPADVRWVLPQLPQRGSGSLDFSMDWEGDSAMYLAENADIRLGDAHLVGKIGVTDTDTLAFHAADLRFTGVSTALLDQVLGVSWPPRPGVLSGSARFDGGFNAMTVDGDVTFVGRGTGRNRVIASGELGVGDEFRARNLRLRLMPVTAEFARIIIPDIPFDGTFTGNTVLNGSTASTLVATGDITHVEAGNRSRGIGRVAVRPGVTAWLDVDARLAPLALATAGQFSPALGLRGFVSGPIRFTGTLRDFMVNTNLAASGGGNIAINGRVDLEGRATAYDLRVNADLFNASAVSSKAPGTQLTATAHIAGTGTNPETMRGNLVADVRTSVWDTLALDSAKVRVAFADGLARFDTLTLSIPQGQLDAEGTFGLSERRQGELRYSVVIDTLAALSGIIGTDTGVVAPRPRILATRIAQARADSLRVARDTEVERAATGRRGVPPIAVDTPRVVPRGLIAGSLRAQGVATGNIRNFGLRGTATGANLVARGQSVGRLRADYEWTGGRTPASRLMVDAQLADAQLAGFELDSVDARVSYQRPGGTAEITIHQDDRTQYGLATQYRLHADHNELHLDSMRLQFDTTLWASTQPSEILWGQRGFTVRTLELTNQAGGRIFVDGLIPRDGNADLRLAVDRFEIADIASLLQSDINARGLLSFDVNATGTMADPRFKGAFGATNFVYNETSLPEVHGTLDYADETLSGRADATLANGRSIIVAEGTVPVNLALTGVTGSRIPRDREIALRVSADSFPVEILPQLRSYVSNVRGRTSGSVTIGGTLRAPALAGNVSIHNGSARIVPTGVTVRSVYGTIRMTGDTVVVDSLVGRSAGEFRVTGGVGVGSFREPSFDLRLFSRNARILDNKRGELFADLDVAMYGPFKSALISGGVRIREGVFYMEMPDDREVVGANDPALFAVLDTAITPASEVFPAQSPLLANLRVDLNLRVDRDVFVRAPNVNVEVYTDGDLIVRANRATQSLSLDGVLLSDRGDYVFFSRRFKIRRGSATFVGLTEINPTLQIQGEYEVRLPTREAINIQIVIGGTLRSPKITLTSDAQPPMAQSDILSYLAFGQSSTTLTQLGGSALSTGGGAGTLVGTGAALATKQLAAVALGVFTEEIAGEAARSLGADVLIISPAEIQTDVGSFLRSTEVEFGKYVNRNTFVSFTGRLDPSALRRPGFTLEHRFPSMPGYRFEMALEPRYLLREPTLQLREPITRSVLGMFLIREWRY
ncbi:MAG: translocation/assembly module TamB domain-containing protein [Gemmatimonadaceae bacterium]